MKANRTLRIRQSDEGAVGIGTLIVFIATILVAAVASAVLIDTSNNLQEKAQRTGQEATTQVATNLDVSKVVGQILSTGTATKINALNVTVGLAPGAKTLDMNQLVIRVTDGTTEKRLSYHATTEGDLKFLATEIRDPEGTWSASAPVLSPGGLVLVNINLNATTNNMELANRKTVELEFIPEVGAPVSADFRTPPSYGADKVFALR